MQRGGPRKIDKERAARIVVDSIALGNVAAADKWQISTKTVQRYRDRVADDPELSAFVRIKNAVAEVSWHAERTEFLKEATSRLRVLLKTEVDLDKVSRAIERVGNLDVAATVLHVGVRPNSQGSTPAEDGVGHGAGEGPRMAH